MLGRSIVLGSLVGISSLFCAVTSYQAAPLQQHVAQKPVIVNSYNPNQSVSSDDAVSPNNLATTNSEPMMIQGTVEQVMESWPLQLTVTTNTGRYYVALQSNTVISQQANTVTQGILQPGMQVQIVGEQATSDPMALKAHSIEIQ